MIRYVWSVVGVPKPQPRVRAARRGRKAMTYDPGTARAWRESTKFSIAAAGGPREPLVGAVRLVLLFDLPRPASHYDASGQLLPGAPAAHIVEPDVDNLYKAVTDAMQEMGVYANDGQVNDARIIKRWSSSEDAGVVIRLAARY